MRNAHNADKEVNIMANILELQCFDAEQTPEADKKSKISIRWCNNSKISIAICWVK